MSIHRTGAEAMMLEAGAKGFVNKEAAVDELYRTIENVLALPLSTTGVTS